jgi:alpha-D-ribose 1-methylphosphonate 5-triphosphate synthase subunit PhnL
MSKPILRLQDVNKQFTVYRRSAQPIDVLENVSFELFPGECLSLDGASGSGKSSILKLIFGNYCLSSGHIWCDFDGVDFIDFAAVSLRERHALRKKYINYVSQFLKAIPRISALDVVIQAGMNEVISGLVTQEQLTRRAQQLLERLNIQSQLWGLPPAIFSGGEQQRINLARGLISPKPLLLLDEPSASLDHQNTQVVIELIQEVRLNGTAMIGIFHDDQVRQALSTRSISIQQFKPSSNL